MWLDPPLLEATVDAATRLIGLRLLGALPAGMLLLTDRSFSGFPP